MCDLVLAALIAIAPAAGMAAEIVSYAIVQPDGSLLVGSRMIRLFGLYIPPTGRTCRTNILPVRCGSRPALALDSKIQSFVWCQEIDTDPAGRTTAICYVRADGWFGRTGEDLGL